MNRVLNYSWEDEEGVKHNIRSMFAEKYGEDAKKYLQRFCLYAEQILCLKHRTFFPI